MSTDSPRVFLRLSDVYGISDDELIAVFGPQIQLVGITRGCPSAEHANEECAVVTLRGDRRTLKPQIERQFKAFRHPVQEPSPDFDFVGFTPLTNGHVETDAGLIDVIAVAGLAGNAFATWQGDKIHHRSHWLRDFLPNYLKNARVWIYGYRSELSDDGNKASILHFADLLRHELVTTAERYNMRNIVLMGHSLGCILIKKALVDLPQDHELFSSLITLVFFGAPHRGFEIKALSEYAFNTLRQQRVQTIIAELGEDSSFLGSLHADFKARLYVCLPHIITVYETRATPTLAQDPVTGKWARTGPPKQAVPLNSAILDLSPGHETLLQAAYDHSGIAKVTKDRDHVYWRLMGTLEKLIRKRSDASSISGTTNSSNELMPRQTGTSSSNLSVPRTGPWAPSNVTSLSTVPTGSWTSHLSTSDATSAAMLQALNINSIPSSEDVPLLIESGNAQVHMFPARMGTTPNPSYTRTISTPSPKPNDQNSKPPGQGSDDRDSTDRNPLAQQPRRRPVPPNTSSTLSTFYPAAGIGLTVQYGQQNNSFRPTGSVMSLPDSVENQPSRTKNDWPEPVERRDWPEPLQSYPSITLRQAPPVKDYQPFGFDPITYHLFDPVLTIVVERYSQNAVPVTTGMAPITFKSMTVSSPHCEFSYRHGKWRIRDLGSSNGTWLNGVRLSEQPKQISQYHDVHDESIIKLGTQYENGVDHYHRCVRLIVDFSDH